MCGNFKKNSQFKKLSIFFDFGSNFFKYQFLLFIMFSVFLLWKFNKKSLKFLFYFILLVVSAEPTNKLVATEERVLEMVEAFYPNPLPLDKLCRWVGVIVVDRG